MKRRIEGCAPLAEITMRRSIELEEGRVEGSRSLFHNIFQDYPMWLAAWVGDVQEAKEEGGGG